MSEAPHHYNKGMDHKEKKDDEAGPDHYSKGDKHVKLNKLLGSCGPKKFLFVKMRNVVKVNW